LEIVHCYYYYSENGDRGRIILRWGVVILIGIGEHWECGYGSWEESLALTYIGYIARSCSNILVNLVMV